MKEAEYRYNIWVLKHLKTNLFGRVSECSMLPDYGDGDDVDATFNISYLSTICKIDGKR